MTYDQKPKSSWSVVHCRQLTRGQAIMRTKNSVVTSLIKREIMKKLISFTFAVLWSHHCEGSEKNSIQRFSTILFWPATHHRNCWNRHTTPQGTSFLHIMDCAQSMIDNEKNVYLHKTIESQSEEYIQTKKRSWSNCKASLSPILTTIKLWWAAFTSRSRMEPLLLQDIIVSLQHT